MTEKKISFNEAVEELETILSQIENGDLDLDELTQQVKRASTLLTLCNKKLKNTEEELNKIVEEME